MLQQHIQGQVANILNSAQGYDARVQESFVSNLQFIYHVTKASEKLLEVAVEQSRGRPDLAYYFYHLEEERGHHTWLAEDLRSVGVDAENTPIPQVAVEMVGTQYYLLYHVDPAALLGYMLVLEGSPPPMQVIEDLERLHGRALLRTTRYHAEHDPEHAADLAATLEQVSEASWSIIAQSAIQTAQYLTRATALFGRKH